MAVKSNKNTVISERFRVAFKAHIERSGKKKIEIADELGLNTGTLSNVLKSGASSAMMEEIANKLGYDLADMLQGGRAILAGGAVHIAEAGKMAGEAPVPPVAALTPPAPPTISPEREMELLRKIEALTDEMLAANAIRNELAAELLAKGRIIATTTEALRIKDIEVAEKREALTAKDQIIGQLVALLKEAGLEHTIPPALTSLIQADREKGQER